MIGLDRRFGLRYDSRRRWSGRHFRLLRLVVFTIASLLTLGHSSSPKRSATLVTMTYMVLNHSDNFRPILKMVCTSAHLRKRSRTSISLPASNVRQPNATAFPALCSLPHRQSCCKGRQGMHVVGTSAYPAGAPHPLPPRRYDHVHALCCNRNVFRGHCRVGFYLRGSPAYCPRHATPHVHVAGLGRRVVRAVVDGL